MKGKNKWLMQSNMEGEVALLCIPYAGASAGMYGKWNQKLGADIRVSALLLPFRNARRKEELPESVQVLAQEIVLENKEFFEKPYVIYGHCTGAILGYEIEKAAEHIYGKSAIAMIVSNAQEPTLVPEEADYLSGATEEEIATYLLQENLIAPEMLELEEFRDYYFPILRADFKLYSEYRCKRGKLLCPIWAFYDEKDTKIQEELVHNWEHYTDEFHTVKVPGGHFSFQNNEDQLLCEIRKVCENKTGKRDSLLGKDMLESMKTYGEKTALIYQEKEYSYAELLQKIYKCQTFYQKRGLKQKDRIAIKLESHPEFVVTFLAAVSLGIVPVLLLPAQGKNESIGVIKAARPKLFLCEEKGEEVEAIQKECEILYGIIEHENLVNLLEMIEKAEEIEGTILSRDEIALLLLSGGTTGIPKLIPRTQGDYLYNIEKMAERLRLNGESVYLSVLPMAHNFGLANPGLLGTLLYGGTVVICEDVAPLEILGMIEEYHVTYTAFVPSILKMCVDYRKEDNEKSLESLQIILSGGAMLPEDLAREADKYLEAKLIQVFGTAEGLICTNGLEDSIDIRATSQGKQIREDWLRLAWKRLVTVHPILSGKCDEYGMIHIPETPEEEGMAGSFHLIGKDVESREQFREKVQQRIIPLTEEWACHLYLGITETGKNWIGFELDLALCDVQSFQILLRDLGTFYEEERTGAFLGRKRDVYFSKESKMTKEQRIRDRQYWEVRLQDAKVAAWQGTMIFRAKREEEDWKAFMEKHHRLYREDLSHTAMDGLEVQRIIKKQEMASLLKKYKEELLYRISGIFDSGKEELNG